MSDDLWPYPACFLCQQIWNLESHSEAEKQGTYGLQFIDHIYFTHYSYIWSVIFTSYFLVRQQDYKQFSFLFQINLEFTPDN